MAAENSNKSKLKMYTSTIKNTFTLVKMQSFSISGVISVRKCKLKIEKFTDVYALYPQSYFGQVLDPKNTLPDPLYLTN